MNPTQPEPLTAAYLARRGVSAQWRGFVAALMETLGEHLDGQARAALMRALGRRMADAMPLPHCDTLLELERRINDALAATAWGYAEIAVDIDGRRLVVTHHAAPAIGVGEDAEGSWVAAVLEGLYGTWFASQPGADPTLAPRAVACTAGHALLRYGRG